MIVNSGLFVNRLFLAASSFRLLGPLKVSFFIFLALISFALQGRASSLDYDEGWREIAGVEWKGNTLTEGKYELSSGIVYAYIDVARVERSWLRISASGRVDSADFDAWIHVFDENGHPLFRPLPTKCGVERDVKVCSSFSWIPEGGRQVRVSFYNSYGGEGVEIESMKVERSTFGEQKRPDLERFNGILLKIKELYYLSHDVDWGVVESGLEYAMYSPGDIDPVPGVVAVLVGRLPEKSHTFIFSSRNKGGGSNLFPTCYLIKGGSWWIDIPAASGDEAAIDEYIARAHDCLRKEHVENWIVNLTDNQGGDAFAQFAALAPIVRGDLVGFENGVGEIFQISVDDQGVRLNGRMVYPVESKKMAGQSIFIFDENCASSCEALAISVKGRFKTFGRRTAGLTTANETIRISDDFSLALTSGWMVDSSGKRFDAVDPDLTLSNEDIDRIMKSEK